MNDIIEKIDIYITNEDISILLELAMFIEYGNDENILNEAKEKWLKKISSILPKVGIEVKRTRPGILGALRNSKSDIKEFFWNLLKASKGNRDAAQRVREMARGRVQKGDVIDFLIKLDTVTLHMISGPIHALEYITGWKISGYKEKGKDIIKRIENALSSLKDLIPLFRGKEKEDIVSFTNNLERMSIELEV